ncbi:MAG TPA: RNA polymerase sigma-54 factor [Acidobacteriota bacterium]|jgi:RNA polymerase sigma-54 factor|nr:RNA polymerase sigma-54 factor [Acidobacteriota bacterium]
MVVRRNSLKPSLSVHLSQRLAMTPSLLQKIELLTLSRLELSDLLNEELMENPILEEDVEDPEEREVPDIEHEPLAAGQNKEIEESTLDDFQSESDETLREIEYYFDDHGRSPFNSREYFSDDRPSFDTFLVRPPSLYDHLEWQINLSGAPENIREIACYLVGNLNEDGYLLVSLEEAAEAASSSLPQVEQAHQLVMHLDPLGVGSRDLQECLVVQIQNLFGQNTLFETLVRHHLPLIQQHKHKEIARDLKCMVEEVVQAMETIRTLDPKPGQKYNPQKPRYIQPDIYIYKTEGIYSCLEHPEFRTSAPGLCPTKVKEKDSDSLGFSTECGRDLVDYEIVMNEDGLPKLRLSVAYRDLLKTNTLPKESRNYIKEKWRSAQELLKSVSQRKHTIYRVCSSIVGRQREFLEAGITHLKPMLIKDVADELGVHSSTISRAVTNKYVHTPQGVTELRSFFTVGVENTAGDDLSIVHVKHKIKQIIEEENCKKPLSDQKIADILNNQGIQITRRTVAKYRDQINVPGSRERRGSL